MKINNIKFFVLILFVIFLSECTIRNPKEKFNYYVEQSIKYKNEGNDKKALENINLALAIDSGQSFGYTIRGQIKSLLKDDSSALIDFSKAIKLNPQNTHAYFCKGLSYSMLDNEDSAINNYNIALNIKKNGDTYWDIKEDPYRKIDTLSDIPIVVLRYYRGKSLYNKKEDLKALEDFEYASNHKYEVGESTFYVGVILLSQGQKKEGCAKLVESKSKGAKLADEYLDRYCK